MEEKSMKKSFKKSMKIFLAGIIVLACAYVPIHTHAAEPNQRIISEELLQKIQELQEKYPDQLIERKPLPDYEYYQIYYLNQLSLDRKTYMDIFYSKCPHNK